MDKRFPIQYRPMNLPFRPQQLQELYPGRLMNPLYSYTGDNIPPEDPDCVAQTHLLSDMNIDMANKELNAMEYILGGRDKIIPNPPVEPEATIEDPSLKGVNIGTPVAIDMGSTTNPNASIFGGVPVDIENRPGSQRENYVSFRDVVPSNQFNNSVESEFFQFPRKKNNYQSSQCQSSANLSKVYIIIGVVLLILMVILLICLNM